MNQWLTHIANVGVLLGIVLLPLFPAISSAQLTPDELADSDRLRALDAAAALLPVERIELQPAVALEGISAIVVKDSPDKSETSNKISRANQSHGDPKAYLMPMFTVSRSRSTRVYSAKMLQCSSNDQRRPTP